MTDQELEGVLRETFRSREHAIAGLRDGLVPAARIRARQRRRWQTVAGAAVATAVLIGGVGLVAALPRLGGGSGPAAPTGSPGDVAGPLVGGGELPHDWVWISSLGLEIGVPGGWAINDYACNQTDRPSVVRALGAQNLCLTPEPRTKQVAVIGSTPEREYGEGFTTTAVTVGGVAATRTDGRLPDGRHAAQLAIPSRHIYLDVRTNDEPELTTILGTARLVDTDHVGCPTQRPAVTADRTGGGSALVPADATRVRVCYYGDGSSAAGSDNRLQASVELGEPDVLLLVSALNAAPAGPNPDAPAQLCSDPTRPPPDAVLQFLAPDGAESRLWVTFSHCRGRGLDNGQRQGHVSAAILTLFMPALHTGYAFHGDLAGYPGK